MANNDKQIAKQTPPPHSDIRDLHLELKQPEPVASKSFTWLIAVLIFAALSLVFLLINSGNRNTTNPKYLVTAGSPEFEEYKNKVQLQIFKDEIIVYPIPTLNTFYMEARGTITNNGNKPITGFELIVRMIDYNDKTLASNIGMPIPAVRSEPLMPGQSYKFKVKVDAPDKITEDDVKSVTLELRGLQFK